MIHSAELVREVDVTYNSRPNADTMLPTVAMNCDVRVVFAGGISGGIDSPFSILLFVDLDREIYHLVVGVYLDTSRGLHDLLVLREDHVLGKVVLCVKLRQIVATNLVRMKICAGNSNDI